MAARGPHSRDFRVSWDESQMARDGLLFIGSKMSEVNPKLEPLLIVLKLISSGSSLKALLRSKLEPLLIS
jgi:hypothetical protein